MRGSFSILIVLLLACASARPVAGTAARPPTVPTVSDPSLFERLGGLPGLEAVVDGLLTRIAQDERLNAPFAMTDIPRTRRRLVELLCVTTGGPCHYSGRDMKTVHAGMGITGAQFDVLAGHLTAAMAAAHVRPEDAKTVLGVVGATRGDIVEAP